jgi:methylated-DNA-[protein]-cysteine S-methyltransferase
VVVPASIDIATPFGRVLVVGADDRGVVASDFRPKPRGETARTKFGHPLLREVKKQVDAYFARRLRRFDLPLHLEGTQLQVAVWQLVSQLSVGDVISYGDVARAIGHPLSHRGVAAAMGKTPLALFIPAHRVVGSDGRIKGAAPNSMRRRLLKFEGLKIR